jgi:hypothetical protein
MPITALPQPPQRNNPAQFADQGDALLGALPLFVTQANALEVNVDAREVSAVAAALAAANSQSVSANNAAISASSAAFKGNWSILTGALAIPSSVTHAGAFWALNTNLANVTTATPGVSASWTRIKVGADNYSYENRASLRSLTPATGDQAIVEGLGLFVWTAGSTEIDDDETCFATASGRWLLEAANWELVDSYDTVTRFGELEFDARFLPSFASSFAAKVLTGSATCAITSVATVSSASFTGTVTGAAIGDRVISTPPNQLGSTATDTARLSYHAWVSAADMVTVMLTNASDSVATTNAAVRAAWPVTVIKT